ncbi:putative uncharacterized protein [Eubacterium sp. CAG:786]|nr:putative uncharacterized protein [Eubacterium sp. CAG:786]
MKTYKYFALICAAVVAAASTGCSNNSANSGSTGSSVTSTNDTSHTISEAGTEDVKQSESYKTVKVTAVDGNTITADEGDIVSGGAPGQPGDGSAPEKPGDDSGGSGSGDGSGAPDKPDGEAGSAPGGMGGSTFEASGSSMTFTVTDDTSISVEFLQGSSDGTIDDIAVGSVLAVTLNGDGTAASVVVKNMNAGSGFGGSGDVTNGTSANTISENTTESDTEYFSTGDDENALRVDSAEVTLTNITVNKSAGSSSNTEDGDFYGQNAGFLALNGARVTITDSTFNTGVVNGNAVFSYGEGTTVNISDSKIRTTERNSGGIQTTGGGTMNATNLDVQTEGNSSAAIRTDRGGGTVNVEGGKYVTNGTGSPAIYCTADITASNAELTANASEGVVVEGKNSVTLNNCTLTGNMENTYGGDSDENIHTIMIYQSMSGDADIGEAYFTAEGGSITGLSGDMFYVTNTDCTISLEDVAFTLANDTFLRVEGNSSSRGWGTEGANGGDVILTAEDQTIEGNILVDSISGLDMTMTNSTFSGAINPDGEGGTVKVTMDGGSTWSLTGDSYVTEFSGDVSRITSNGYHLYVNGEQIV